MITAATALGRLREGNRRFVSDHLEYCSISTHRDRRRELAAGQAPFAVILGCSDSRVPVEIVFDQGLGDLFVIRVAGNIVGPSQEGSIEFAAQHFGTPLVVVLGHSRCGAVQATLDALEHAAECPSTGLCSLIRSLEPSVKPVLEVGDTRDPQLLLERAVRSNIRKTVRQLRESSVILKPLVREGRLVILGAEYNIETGEVVFFDDD